jgi:ABC-type multidrug transport system fused ATPase/permease subunit
MLIARALLKNPPLLLDEATSALDAEASGWCRRRSSMRCAAARRW